MQRILYFPFILLALSALFIRCSEESNPQFEADNFTRVYDNNQFNMLYAPLDVEQTADGGFLILASMRTDTSGMTFPGVYLIKTDKYGKFVKETPVDAAFTDYVSATPDLMPIGEQFYFVCMNITTQAKLVTVSPDADIVATADIGGVNYPLATSLDDSNIVLLWYDHANKKTVLSTLNSSGATIGNATQFDLGPGGEDDLDSYIIESFMVDGRKFPYFVGRIGKGTYYFNAFTNYTLSLVFTNANGGNPGDIAGSVLGQQDDGGISALVPLGAGKFASARYMFKENYLLPNLALQTNGSVQATDLTGLNFPEMVSNSPVKVIRATINDKNVIIYGVNTKSGQIALIFYDEATGKFISSRYLGFSNPYEIGCLQQTKDGGITVGATTQVAGRFARVCLFKFSKDELAKNANR